MVDFRLAQIRAESNRMLRRYTNFKEYSPWLKSEILETLRLVAEENLNERWQKVDEMRIKMNTAENIKNAINNLTVRQLINLIIKRIFKGE